ncbi:hypothetical protein GLOTRDRAFT_136899 [Gloeophyllum trabeum ATCC 11539]|uniref:F-box domain-containing protein n=1 Tax=Gloeophyllum trabeum (strain ATCC 11539 / FP-39264 / Madison 617) TaxID=670483 RepID=S7QG33_GLOTA|nr:uncharacterized protein GLOTRDRAFT_136899 [Gloeophyllum trabeum ATCC 11539]EPQ58123.1 hypothetical protein GLOTRDRAFT_136899 [Gloeophyllum trabeum ATCC 11539]
MASSLESTGTVAKSSRKRRRNDTSHDESTMTTEAPGAPSTAAIPSSAATADSPVKKKRRAATGTSAKKDEKVTVAIPPWSDIPEWKTDKCPLLEMPVEILDRIFSPESGLRLQDHLALSGTCRAIRKAYTEQVWKALASYSTHYGERAIVNRIFSTAWLARNEPQPATDEAPGQESSSRDQQSPKKGKSKAVMTHKDLVVQMVNYSQPLSTTEAKAKYKLTDKELLTLPFGTKRNPYRRNGPPIRSFKDARVYALAMRVHGGPFGHEAHLKKLAERSAKTKATKTKNGTLPVKKPKPDLSLAMMFSVFMSSLYNDEYDTEDYVYDDY